MKILLVDDEKEACKVYALMLADFDCQVLETATGTEALELVEKERPDVVLLDYYLPGMSGYTVLQCIRKTPAIAKTPVIFTTGLELDPLAKDLIKRETQEFLEKPFSAKALIQAVQKATGKPLSIKAA